MNAALKVGLDKDKLKEYMKSEESHTEIKEKLELVVENGCICTPDLHVNGE